MTSMALKDQINLSVTFVLIYRRMAEDHQTRETLKKKKKKLLIKQQNKILKILKLCNQTRARNKS